VIEALISTFAMFLVLYIAFWFLPTELFGLCENDIWQIVDYVGNCMLLRICKFDYYWNNCVQCVGISCEF